VSVCVFTAVSIQCDHRDAFGVCLAPGDSRENLSDIHGLAKPRSMAADVWRQMKALGWKRIDGKHYCPKHTAPTAGADTEEPSQ
jgi:hypothetical protein